MDNPTARDAPMDIDMRHDIGLVFLGCAIIVFVFVPVVVLVSALDAPPGEVEAFMETARNALRGLAALLTA